MTSRRRPPRPAVPPEAALRPRLTLVAPDASPEEAAAIVAALERFISDTAPPPPPPPATTRSRWTAAALLEGISRGHRRRRAWGDPNP